MGMFDNIKPLKGKPGGDQIPENDALSQIEYLERTLADNDASPEHLAWCRRAINRFYEGRAA